MARWPAEFGPVWSHNMHSFSCLPPTVVMASPPPPLWKSGMALTWNVLKCKILWSLLSLGFNFWLTTDICLAVLQGYMLFCPDISDKFPKRKGGMRKRIIGIQAGACDFLIFFFFLYLYSHVVQPLQSLLILVQVVSLVVVPYLTFVIMK